MLFPPKKNPNLTKPSLVVAIWFFIALRPPITEMLSFSKLPEIHANTMFLYHV